MSFMRQLTIYLILISIFLSNNLRSQTEMDLENPVAKKISLVFQDASLRDLISEISNLSGVKFVFDDELLQVKKLFTVKIKDKTTVEILKQILKDPKIGFVVQSKSQVVLTKKSTIKARYGTIKGRVVNSITGEPLWKANLEILTTSYGAASNKGGFFELRALAGVHHLRMSMIGFIAHERHLVRVSADKATYVTFRLRPTVIEMPAVQVSSKRYLVPEHMQIEPSVLTVRRSQLTDIPSIGEPDLFRVLQALPGISAPNDISNELFIRGGDSDQNLIMLDGAVVYNPYHMFGLVGSFNPDIIEQVNLSLGGFSARYGDRLSAVVDVRTINDAPEHFGGFANFSLISSKFMAMGNVDSKVNWIVSGRRTYHDAVASLFKKSVPYYFYDLYGKLAVRPNVRNLFYFSGFFSRDLFLQKDNYRSPNVEDTDNPFEAPDSSVEIPDGEGFIFDSREEIIWDNLILSAHWLHEFSEGNNFEIQVSQSENPSDFLFNETSTAQANASVATREFVERRNRIRQEFDDFQTDILVRDRTARMDIQLTPFRQNTLSFGGGYSSIRLNYFWQIPDLDQDEVIVFFDAAPDSFNFQRALRKHYFYFEDLWKWNRLSVRPGIRFEKRDYNDKWAIEPRFNLSYQFSPAVEMKMAYGHFYQGLATSTEEGLIQFLPVLFPTEDKVPLERAEHFIGGLSFSNSKWKVSGEVYYKKFTDLLRAVNGTPEFEQGTGEAYGLELSTKKLGDRFNLEVNYAFSFAKRQFGLQEYFSRFDRRHNFTAIGKYNLGKNWLFNFRWVLSTGRPFTPDEILFRERIFDPLTGQWLLSDNLKSPKVDFSTQRNRVRYPLYHRLDISFMKRIQKRGWAILPYLQVINTYYKRNVLFYEWDLKSESGVFVRNTIPMMPIVPTFGVSFEF